MTCRDCQWWDIDAARDKAGRVRRKPAPCLAPLPVLPESHMLFYGRQVLIPMRATEGTDCPLFQKREGQS